MEQRELKEILDKHAKWTRSEPGGERANLEGAYLYGANLKGANLKGANLKGANLEGAYLYGANLKGANLDGANLKGANLEGAYLYGANLEGANLKGANLEGAYLYGANLEGAYLYGAYLEGAYLYGANLKGANLPETQICPEVGTFTAFKKGVCRDGRKVLITLEIPADAQRINGANGRKCRASKVRVVGMVATDGSLIGPADIVESPTYLEKLRYEVGKELSVDNFCDDIRQDCAAGIHFFIRKQEALSW